jgi:hypothetical protein
VTPTSVQVGAMSFRIVFDDALADAGDCWGRIDYPRQIIFLDSRTQPDHLAITVLHEVLHAVHRIAGVQSDAKEEAIVTQYAPLLLDVLRRNPDLVAYLTEAQ